MTQGILVLIGTLLGAIVSGVLVLFNQHFQAKRDDRRQQLAFERDDRRQQRDFERAIRGECLERIKHAVDLGLPVLTDIQLVDKDILPDDTIIAEAHQFVVALNGARVSATTIEETQVINELNALIRLLRQFPSLDNDQILECFDHLARIERRYLELKVSG